jgi:phosphoribosyl 1,2-cyclic phosphodiesterase
VKGSESASDIALVVLGARGSIPVSGREFLKYGGSTTCFAIAEGNMVSAFVDAGTGLMSFRTHGLELAGQIPVFLTHYHWDHIQGVSMLGEVWAGACLFTFYGPGDPEPMLTESIRPPWFPVSLVDAPEPVEFGSVAQPISTGQITVTAFEVQHPQGGVGYRIQGPNRSVAIVTDHESLPACDDIVAEAIDGVDVLIHDSQYIPSEAVSHQGWGHSTWEDAVRMAKRVGASELILTSHEPSRTDADVDAVIALASQQFPNTTAASPGLRIPL